MFEVDKMNDISNILELSNEDKNSINFIINNILGKSNDFKFNILSKFTRLKEISLSIKILREKLNSTVSGDFLNNYLETTAILNKQISETENIIASSKAKLEEKYKQLSLKEYHLTRAKMNLHHYYKIIMF